LPHIPNSNGRDGENEDRCQPDQPMGAELLRCSLESLVGEVPLEVDEAPGDLAQKADHQESKKLAFGPSGTSNPEHRISLRGLRYVNASR
jgi:hypothetical protein